MATTISGVLRVEPVIRRESILDHLCVSLAVGLMYTVALGLHPSGMLIPLSAYIVKLQITKLGGSYDALGRLRE